MSSPSTASIREDSREASTPPNQSEVSSTVGSAFKDNGGIGTQDTTTSAAIAAQPQSIWHKYVTIAEELDQRMMEKWKTNLGNLLIFAALFTAIVTAFVLDVMSDLNESTSTQLLRTLVEQSTTGQDVDIPQPRPPSSVVMVGTLWFLSIMSSLAATTWAILSLEWCAFLTAGGVRSEDYEEEAEKRQRKFEAIRRWKMHLIVASIPTFLHGSLFLFLAGLWLRLRDMNEQLGLAVGISSLIIAVTYAMVTLLPLFTEAPFSTSVSELVLPLVNDIKYLLKLCRFVRPPPVFVWISRPLALVSSKLFSCLDSVYHRHLYFPLRVAATLLIHLLKFVYKYIGPLAYGICMGTRIILWAISPTFPPGGDPFKELSRFRTGPSDRNKGVHQRALFWLMTTLLTQPEVKEVLKELRDIRDQASVEEPLDRGMVRLLVSSLSSVLSDGRITEHERPIFDQCTRLLTEEMARVFRDAEYDPRILVWGAAVSGGLGGYVNFKTSTPPPQAGVDDHDDYWNKVVQLLWLSPSVEQIQAIIKRLEPSAQLMARPLLQRIVCGLHAATLSFLRTNKKQSALDLPLPDFSEWDFSDDGWSASERLDLDRELSAFLQNLLIEFHKTTHPDRQKHACPTTIPSLIAACKTTLNDGDLQTDVSVKFHSALYLFITTTWRSNPGAFDTDPSVAQALVTSAKKIVTSSTSDTPNRPEEIAIRLRTIAYGPHTSSSAIASLYAGPVKDDPICLAAFIHVTAAVLEAVLLKERPPGVLQWQHLTDRWIMGNIVSPPFFTDHRAFEFSRNNPDYRLPYLYSLAIALSYGIGGDVQYSPGAPCSSVRSIVVAALGLQNSLKVLHLLWKFDGEQGNAAIERILHTNTLAVHVLTRALPAKAEAVAARMDIPIYLGRITQALKPLQGIIENRRDYSWRTRWKAIYLFADIVCILPRVLTIPKELRSCIDNTSTAAKLYIDEQLPNEPAPCDWRMKRNELELCGLEEAVRDLAKRDESAEGVYSWRGPENIPYLSLYPQRTRNDLTPRARYRLLEKLQRFIDADGSAKPEYRPIDEVVPDTPGFSRTWSNFDGV